MMLMMMAASANISVHLLCAEQHAEYFPYIQAKSPLPISCYLLSPITFVSSTESTECCRLKPPLVHLGGSFG